MIRYAWTFWDIKKGVEIYRVVYKNGVLSNGVGYFEAMGI